MLRNRDIAAAILALILTRMAWNENLESLSASVHLAFYFPRVQSPSVSPFDLDGDGTSEAIVTINSSASSASSWVLKVLDLKPLHQFGKTYLAPFRPNVLFTSPEMKEGDGGTAKPLKITTGQVIVKQDRAAPASKQTSKNSIDYSQYDERSRHYFCGVDWHDAASKCGTPCPTGSSSDCPDGQSCYADTPCDGLASSTDMGDTDVLFHLTPGGGLPSIITFWSNGILSLTSLTADKIVPQDSSDGDSSKGGKTNTNNPPLELRHMWRTQVLPDPPTTIEWEEISIRFLDAYDTDPTIAKHGMIILSASYVYEQKVIRLEEVEDGDQQEVEDVESTVVPFSLAVDAMTGSLVWDSFSDEQKNGGKPLPLPVERGTSSAARRRSRIALMQEKSSNVDDGNLPNCMVAFKQSLRTALPYAYWGPNDADLQIIHLEQKTRNSKQSLSDSKNHAHEHGHEHHKTTPAAMENLQLHKKKWHQKFTNKRKHQRKAIYGRPNALVTHSQGGLEIRSLANGKPLCHLSLLDETLYADLNNDGILDQVQVVLDKDATYNMDPWTRRIVHDLLQQARRSREEQKETKMNSKVARPSEAPPTICHALAFSGMPAREELFSSSLCGKNHERMGNHPAVALDAVPPIVVESLYGRRGSRDVILALNNGIVHRLHGGSGRKEWRLQGNHHDEFPTWERNRSRNAILTRVHSQRVSPSVRPALLVGENGLAVLSVKTGAILASTTFPQTTTARPVLAEVSGDGTTDVIVMSTDGIWGFQIVVTPGASIIMRIMVGLLLMGIMLAVLRNRLGQRTDKRSTDE